VPAECPVDDPGYRWRNHTRAFDHYQPAMRELVTRSRQIGPTTMNTLIPATDRQVWLTIQTMRVLPRLPAAAQRRLFAFQAGPARALNSITLPDEHGADERGDS
jgi:hypothetical protein